MIKNFVVRLYGLLFTDMGATGQKQTENYATTNIRIASAASRILSVWNIDMVG